MKSIKNIIVIACSIFGILAIGSCEDILEEENKSQLAAENLLTSKIGIETVIAGSYSKINHVLGSRDVVKREEMTSDIMWQTGGGENGTAVSLIGFFWDSNNWLEAFDWGRYWNAIRDANTVLDNIDGLADVSEQEKVELIAEARFLRIWAYYILWNQYGAMPIRTSLTDPAQKARATDDEFSTFMETELLSIITDLPNPGEEPNYGRVHSDGARALLCKWYLNNKDWKKSADMAQEIIDRNYFELFPSAFELFSLENERNNEFILVHTGLANESNSVTFVATALPPGFSIGLDGGLNGVVNETWSNFASQYRFYDEFYNSFEIGDTRRNRILTRYINSNSEEINLLDTPDNTRGMKFEPDPDTQGSSHGNDFPSIRYADILLSKSESLNELNGPNQESVDLVNLIRNRAELADVLLGDFPDKESFRVHILDERRWEFWYEGKRRRDLLRMDKYLESASSRGINVEEKHKLFPIPQVEIDANQLMVQNPGY
ncbi:RagB/SusD family nutrient uptake outer membrane protein [Maribacter sp. ACAM166]|uniref:RagB/SusD family nutrient uptake outer membrane protein n=1 Tax=Maribacter sp. ACAM166 TaxID=2508996 RepID=UPI0010FE7A21|nr:RagB/SusD family nutrient uptake outer membrane protein [Maribacter sp. ACAM166]TLP71844.1 RagB/SusD family nutrient uptake outer membrane protein [Maribacter sp. ACAM166]